METTILGLYWDNGKEHGNYYIVVSFHSLLTASECHESVVRTWAGLEYFGARTRQNSGRADLPTRFRVSLF